MEAVIPEDWGWCVMCQREPFMLWVGCGNVNDPDHRSDDSPPAKHKIVWHCFTSAEVFFWKRLFKKIDTGPALGKLAADLQAILSQEKAITLVDEP